MICGPDNPSSNLRACRPHIALSRLRQTVEETNNAQVLGDFGGEELRPLWQSIGLRADPRGHADTPGRRHAAAPTDVNARFSDTYAFAGLKLQLVYSCYLIKHGNDYMLWDTGQSMTAGPVAPKISVADLLAQLDVKPEQVKFVGISHYHGDHTGQVDRFRKRRC